MENIPAQFQTETEPLFYFLLCVPVQEISSFKQWNKPVIFKFIFHILQGELFEIMM